MLSRCKYEACSNAGMGYIAIKKIEQINESLRIANEVDPTNTESNQQAADRKIAGIRRTARTMYQCPVISAEDT